MNQRSLAVILVGVSVGLSLVSAVVLKEAANMHHVPTPIIVALIILVVIINLVRVGFWSAIHKRFRLSDSYPLTSLFFPMILVLSALYGEEIGLAKLVGTSLITLGVLILSDPNKPGASSDKSVRKN